MFAFGFSFLLRRKWHLSVLAFIPLLLNAGVVAKRG